MRNIEVLCLRTTPERGSFWQNVTGAVEEGENYIAAAKRELLEETGITGNEILAFHPLYDFTFTDRKGQLVREHVFGAIVEPGTPVNIDGNVYREHDEFRWETVEQAKKIMRYPGHADSIERLCRFISSG